MAAARWTTSSSARVWTSCGLELLELSELGQVGQLHRLDRAVRVLGEDEDVHDPDDPGVVEAEQLVRALAGEVLLPRREFDDQVVDGPELVERSIFHEVSFSLGRSSLTAGYSSTRPNAFLTEARFRYQSRMNGKTVVAMA